MSVLIVRGIGLCSVDYECSKRRATHAQGPESPASLLLAIPATCISELGEDTVPGQAGGLVTA
jgi:hypothetical protein